MKKIKIGSEIAKLRGSAISVPFTAAVDAGRGARSQRRRGRVRRAFSLLEMMIVVAIVACTAALLMSAVLSAKRSAHRSASISNMRQITLSALMYREETEHLPALIAARSIVPRSITVDGGDYWRATPAEDWPLMLGSYGYPFETQGEVDFLERMAGGDNMPLATSIFYSDPRIHPFKGSAPPSRYTGAGVNVGMPRTVLVARANGSVKIEPVPHLIEKEGYHQGFTWKSMYFGLARPK